LRESSLARAAAAGRKSRTTVTEQPPDNPGIVAPPPLIALATLLLGLTLEWLFPLHLLAACTGRLARICAGSALVVAGIALAFAAVRRFRRAGTNVEPWRPALVLATDGPYGWVRNPMYVGVMLTLAGFGLALAADWVVALLAPLALVLHVGVVKREERYLAAKFGAPYRVYLVRVPRYGIRVGRR
jgi:protein-S-isoprenylcysteine O-methyltransferase Ste14